MTLTPYYYAYKCLDSIYRQGAFSGIELNRYLSNARQQDKPLISKLVYGVLDRDIELDYIISLFTEKVKPAIRPILKIGVYMIKYLNIPDFAAVNETVKLTKDIGKAPLSGYVNAVLRNIERAVKSDKIKYPENRSEYLSVKYSFPLWAAQKLIIMLGDEEAEEFLSYEEDHSFTHIRVNTAYITADDFEKKLDTHKVRYKKSYIDGAYYVKTDALTLVGKRNYIVQSLGSMLAANAVQGEKAHKVLDVCAAPGGKSVFIKQRFESDVTACDIHPHRVELIRSYAEKAGVEITARVNDALIPVEEWKRAFDRVLCDVPCSGFGVFHSKPDIKLNKSEETVKELVPLQLGILRQSAEYVKTGGKLVYSTCTVFEEENQEVVSAFLKENPDFVQEETPVPAAFGEAPRLESGAAQFYPYRDGVEGFFIAVMRKIR